MSLDRLQRETVGEGDSVTDELLAQTSADLTDLGKQVEQIAESRGQEAADSVEIDAQLEADVSAFIEAAVNNQLGEYTGEFNAEAFDKDGEAGLDKFEFEQFSQSLDAAIDQIILLDGLGAFEDTHEEADDISNTWWTRNISRTSGWAAQKAFDSIDFSNPSPEELQRMREQPFSLMSSEFYQVLWQDFGEGVKDVIEFLFNLPAAAVLYFSQYRSLNEARESGSLNEAVEADIKIQELIKQNPALGLAEISWEMFESLYQEFTSGTNGGVSQLLLTTATLVTGGAMAARLGATVARRTMIKTARSRSRMHAGRQARRGTDIHGRARRRMVRGFANGAGRVERTASRVDDIVGGAGLGHLTGSYSTTPSGRPKLDTTETVRLTEVDHLAANVLSPGTKCKLPGGHEFTITKAEKKANGAWVVTDEIGEKYIVGSIDDWIAQGIINSPEAVKTYKLATMTKVSAVEKLYLRAHHVSIEGLYSFEEALAGVVLPQL